MDFYIYRILLPALPIDVFLTIGVTVPSVAVVGAKKEAHFPSVLPNRRE
jgi:hypothetical protein